MLLFGSTSFGQDMAEGTFVIRKVSNRAPNGVSPSQNLNASYGIDGLYQAKDSLGATVYLKFFKGGKVYFIYSEKSPTKVDALIASKPHRLERRRGRYKFNQKIGQLDFNYYSKTDDPALKINCEHSNWQTLVSTIHRAGVEDPELLIFKRCFANQDDRSASIDR